MRWSERRGGVSACSVARADMRTRCRLLPSTTAGSRSPFSALPAASARSASPHQVDKIPCTRLAHRRQVATGGSAPHAEHRVTCYYCELRCERGVARPDALVFRRQNGDVALRAAAVAPDEAQPHGHGAVMLRRRPRHPGCRRGPRPHVFQRQVRRKRPTSSPSPSDLLYLTEGALNDPLADSSRSHLCVD